jgi:acetyl esterase/lipase
MPQLPGVSERLQGAVATLVGSLPRGVHVVLAGRRRNDLDPEVQLALRLLSVTGHRGLDTMTVAQARTDTARSARIFAGPTLPLARVEPLTIPAPAGAIPARLYVPRADARRRPLVVYFHGGGWVVGGLDTHDRVCRVLAREADAIVTSVDYRLAPEHRFPAAIDDALAAFRWAVENAELVGADPTRVAVAGDSAGGNLAAVVAQLAVADGGPRPAAQLLIYPVTDVSKKHPSYRLFSHGYFLTEAEMDWYRAHYLPSESLATDPRVSPLLANDVRDLPPAVVLTSGFDVLRDEGEAYAARLKDAGVPTTHKRHAGQIHGFANATGVSRASRAAMTEAAKLLRATLDA